MFCTQKWRKKNFPADGREVSFWGNCLLEAVADAEGDALPAEAAVVEVVDRAPVEGNVDGRRRDFELHAELAGEAGVEAARVSVVVETELHTGADIEVDDAGVGEDEVIHTGHIEAVVGPKTEVGLEEAGAATVLIGDFSAVTGTDTEGAGLSGCHSREREYGKY